MSDAARFCPECGDPVTVDPDERAPLPEHVGRTRRRERALCDSCYFDRFDFVSAPERVEVRVCASCGAVRRGERWVDVGAQDYTDIAIEVVSEALGVHVDAEDVTWSVEPEQVDPNTIRMHATFSGVVRGTPIEDRITVPVKISRETCTRCGRIAGDYYAGTVQIRAAGARDPSREEIERATEIAHEVVATMEETGDRDAFITDVSETEGGLDVKVSTTKIGRKIADRVVEEFGGTVSGSETLVTEDGDGNEVYRVSFAVRLPPYKPGDVIDPQDGEGPVLVRSVRGNLKGRRLATGQDYEVGIDDVNGRLIGTIDDGVETTLVTVEDDRAVQVLDPETYEATTIPRPTDLDEAADSVRVLKHRTGMHVLPPS